MSFVETWMPVLGASALGLAVARALVHRAILHGLRAPRLVHARWPAGVALADRPQVVSVPTQRGRRLFGWYLAPTSPVGPSGEAAPARAAHPAVLVMHGWGANAELMWPLAVPLRAAGLAVLLLDARCHGLSDDERFTSLPRFAEDMAAGLAWLRTQPGIAPQRLGLIGHSVGAGAALLHAAQAGDVAAVVSLSTFAHPQEVMRRFLADRRVPYRPLGWYVMRHVQRTIGARFDDIAPLHSAARVRCPLLLVHGTRDATVPFDDARRLARAAPHARLLPVDADHDLREVLGTRAAELEAFLRAALVPAGGHPRAAPAR